MNGLDALLVNKSSKTSVYQKWEAQDVAYLEANFQYMDNKSLAKELRTSTNRVAKKLCALGLKRDYKIKFPDLDGEYWKVFPDEPNYLVSNMGRFRNAKNNLLLKPWYSSSDYYYLDFGNKNYLAHRVVAITWVENLEPDVKTEVNHINGVKEDFRPCQLEWVTPSENQIHAFSTGLKSTPSGVDNHNAKLSESCVRAIRASSLPSRKLGEMFGVDKKVVLNVKNGVSYKDVV